MGLLFTNLSDKLINQMDFKLVFEKLLTFFHENNVRDALMGGFALGVYGVARSTVDMDFLIRQKETFS